MSAFEDLDRHLKTVDPDRWLATRFIGDAERRADVMALYAFDRELERARTAVSEPMLGEIRLAWWQEAVDDAFAGRAPRAHPVVEALDLAVRRRAPDATLFEALIDARGRELDPDPFDADAGAHAEASEGSVMALAGAMLDPQATADQFRAAGRAWGLSRLVLGGRLSEAASARVGAEVSAALAQAPKLSPEAFPATAYAIFARDYVAGRAPRFQRPRLIWAVARGRL
jgi:phytoene synthase